MAEAHWCDLRFRSEDGRFGLVLPAGVAERMLAACRRSGALETGGILIGHYTAGHDWAVVSAASAAPPDSGRGPTWFHRGLQGLQRRLERVWLAERQYYLGEWHLHPLAPPEPSPTDVEQMSAIARSCDYYCPEAILVIVGGDVQRSWTMRAFVFVRGEQQQELLLRAVGGW